MALAYAGVRCELRELVLKDKPIHMLECSPKGTVPVVITQEHQVIDESIDVMLWALQTSDVNQWRANLPESIHLIENSDEKFKPLLDRYKYADRFPELNEQQHRDNTLPFINSLNERLQNTEFLLAKHIRLADIALFPFIRQYAFVDKPWFDQLPIKHLQNWLVLLLDSPLFKKVMKKYKLFNQGHTYTFPETP